MDDKPIKYTFTEKQKNWIDYLKTNPKKYHDGLYNPENDCERCCLGHGAFTLGKLEKNYSPKYGKIDYFLEEEDFRDLGLHDGEGTVDFRQSNPLTYKGEVITDKVDGKPVVSLAVLNDYTEYNHAQIAEIIEENAKKLFIQDVCEYETGANLGL